MGATRKQIEDWLDMQMGLTLACNTELLLEKGDDKKDKWDLKLQNYSSRDYVQIGSKPLRFVAKKLNLEIEETYNSDDPDVMYHLEIIHNGMKFIAIESEDDHKKAVKGE